MEQLEVTGIILRLCLFNILMINWNSATAIAHKDQSQSLINLGGQGLYNVSDDVVILNATNFKTSVYESTRSWLVEFYNSWCGFCYRFAPTWKALASDVLSWNDIVVVSAIDCADDDNNPICREYEIMHYPMLKYFSINAHSPSLGIVIEKGDSVDSVRSNLINRLETEQQEGRGSTWPNIAPYRNVEITDIWKTASSNVKHFFLIFESTDSHLGAEVILDLHKISSLQIRRVTSDNELLCVMNKVTKFPTLIAFGRNESQRIISVRIPTRQGIRQAIKDYVIARGVNIDEMITTVSHNTMHVVEITHQTTIATIIKNHQVVEEQLQSSKNINDYLYQIDLENALRYSINHEISLMKSIDGEKMKALRKYLVVLATYFPLRRNNVYLEVIRDVVEKKNTMTGEEFSQLAKTTEEEMSPVYSGAPRQWIGCKGSTDSYRGYPCGLWIMFHMLTVNFALERNKDVTQTFSRNPTAVLRAMHGYIGTFFGCADCATHFLEMADKNKIFDVRSKDEAVLWLWQAHNRVNARLSGDDTEDPEHKKIQYPAAEHCPVCRHVNNSWNEEEVLRYLKVKYDYNSIKFDEISASDEVDMTNGNDSRMRLERLAKETKRATAFGWDLNIFDISICVVLYVTSAAILVLVCIKFAVKRTYKKKSHINLLSKV
ncbi:PREDICTED: sulfhydryl oxidase 2-like [Trachymyrmex cornetzi]|uniref:Sulfhydryl oxidase n=1 Tax=Trachymyrmex cornetzi TaxID=471704 RepID=A0A195DFB6_9HYME|nr:PREDICTED: sulfhydryl oxidase 2-like [Trachymyrmex cornetzi]XP_018373723.1 PREDICTED: sulfhydryl oxidase 2-like [Trachymyrmex cornetzi]XP_018373724.1 PREDICTED: sulfhydryl oxidase 2-like [Trachymyrmex cornetzi]XP_018373725.1 PREDICTED: sulfhydryl oxidase 2-like [Trachymyrmex cornetzi]XP_018373726.1 PREDICTED: sulfhydryl oxidase 2-like [Trachymyrmex cornetzi]XP_018373727.1 PREDICTED: sulfhydryl oxidase 2-like [Trachymyrmex cornetzi]KYN11595.1 Sulfhydryl oxidase 2 [Trachymyrmex cornetzi]